MDGKGSRPNKKGPDHKKAQIVSHQSSWITIAGLGVVYHKTSKDRLVILSRFATFLESVPSDPPQGTQESSSDSQ